MNFGLTSSAVFRSQETAEHGYGNSLFRHCFFLLLVSEYYELQLLHCP